MYRLENNLFSITVNELGGELVSAVCKKNNLSYMWRGDPQYWGGVSPVLFPVVGGLKEDQYQLNGKTYKMPKHGFLRNKMLQLKSQTEDELQFVFCSDDETLACYPFAFEVVISYKLVNNMVITGWEVQNKTDGPMYFSIGGHPAFNVPLLDGESLTDYTIALKRKGEVMEYEVDTEKGFICEKGPFHEDEIKLKENIFQNDALIFNNIDEAILENKNNPYRVRVVFKDFPFVGFWAQYNPETKEPAPFVCIEPWCGIADFVEHDGDFKKKDGIICLEENQKFEAFYEIYFE